jgi:hypothetical protein
MSNVNRQAKGTTMLDKKLAKAQERNINLEQQLQSARMQILNFRQMYEAAIQERQGIQMALGRTQQILIGLILQSKGGKAVLREKTFAKLAEYAGYDTEVDGEDLILTPVSVSDVEDMEAEIEEQEDGG